MNRVKNIGYENLYSIISYPKQNKTTVHHLTVVVSKYLNLIFVIIYRDMPDWITPHFSNTNPKRNRILNYLSSSIK